MVRHRHLQLLIAGYVLAAWAIVHTNDAAAKAAEPPAINPFAPSKGQPPTVNPFGPVQRDRDDSVPGYVELSNGQVYAGNVYMTRDKRLKLYDKSTERQREIPLRVVKQIQCKVLREWMEKEWRFKELALDEKYFTGRTYPAREYDHTVTLDDDRTIVGPLAEIIYVQPIPYSPKAPLKYRSDVKPLRFMLHKRYKGHIGSDLDSLTYVKLIKLGEEALAEGRRKAAKYRPESKSPSAGARTSR